VIVDPDAAATPHALHPVGAAPFNYVNGVVFESDPIQLPPGMHSFRFEAQDRFQTVQLPPAPGKYDGPKVNFPPELSNVEVLKAPRPDVHTVGAGNVLTPPLVGTLNDTYTFRITYKDVDQNNPTVPEPDHYVRLIIDNGAPIAMLPQGTDYANGVVYQATVSNLTPGDKAFRFEAFDGPGAMGDTVRLPAGGGQITGLSIKNVPQLSAPGPVDPNTNDHTLTPLAGTRSTIYQYRVRYKHLDNTPPTKLQLVIDPGQATQKTVDMVPQTAGPYDYTVGVIYGYDTSANELAVGAHSYEFTYDDGLTQGALSGFTGPTVSNALLTLTAPVSGTLSPIVGPPSTTFTYQVIYTNADNNAPEYVRVVVDGVSQDMTRATTSTDYRIGVLYELKYRFPRDEQQRNHTYHFLAKDTVSPTQVLLPAAGELAGPTLNTAFFVVTGVSQPPAPVGGPIVVGGTVKVDGRLDTNSPVGVQSIPVQLIRPDGSGVNESATTAADGTLSFTSSTVLDQTGDWKARLSWNGVAGTYDPTTLETTFQVKGASVALTGGVLDMIALPVVPVTPDPSTTFNPTRGNGTTAPISVLDLVTWAPTMPPSGKYVSLNYDANFPGAIGGRGYWTLPTESVTLNPRGKLWDQTAPFSVSVAAGWNIVGSVFTTDINWSAVQVRYQGNVMPLSSASAVLKPYAWGYDPATGSYTLVQAGGTLRPGRGYWVRAIEPCEIILNPLGGPTAPLSRDADVRTNALQVVARLGKRMDIDNYLPLSGAPTRAIVEKPPYLGEYATIQQIPSSEIAADVPTRAGQYALGFEARTNVPNADITISFPTIASLGRRYEARLIDLSTKTTRALTNTSGYTYNSGESAATRRFAVVVTPVMANSRLVITDLRATGRAAGTTTFNFTLSNAASVKAQIVAASGNVVRNIAQGRAAAVGANTVMWDGRDSRGISVPSGTYLLKLTATDTEGRAATAVLPVTVVR